MWAVRKYLCHFERLGYETLATVTIDDVQRFILKVASEVKTSTLHDLFLYLRHFHAFLKEIAPDSVELFSNRVYREMPIQGYVTDKELECILNVIDTSTEAGKRNRAMILLGENAHKTLNSLRKFALAVHKQFLSSSHRKSSLKSSMLSALLRPDYLLELILFL